MTTQIKTKGKKGPMVRARVELSNDLHKQLQHLAVDEGVTVAELLVRGAQLLLKQPKPKSPSP